MITADKNRVCVNGVWITLEFCDPESKCLYHKSEFCMGLFCGFDAKIYLDNRMEETICKRTITHEITHAVIQYAQIEGCKDSYSEEDVCQMMAMYSEQISKSSNDLMKQIIFTTNPAKCPDRKHILSFREEESNEFSIQN